MIEANLLELALEQLKKRGLVELSLTELAKQAHCSKTTVYKVFVNKNDLVAKVYLNFLKKREKTAITLADDNTLNYSERLVCFFAHRIWEERQKPNPLGLHTLPSCSFLWEHAPQTTKDEVSQKVKKIHLIPENIIQNGISARELSFINEDKIKILIVKMMAIERGYVTVHNNIDLREHSVKILFSEVISKLFKEISSITIKPQKNSISRVIQWIENNTNTIG